MSVISSLRRVISVRRRSNGPLKFGKLSVNPAPFSGLEASGVSCGVGTLTAATFFGHKVTDFLYWGLQDSLRDHERYRMYRPYTCLDTIPSRFIGGVKAHGIQDLIGLRPCKISSWATCGKRAPVWLLAYEEDRLCRDTVASGEFNGSLNHGVKYFISESVNMRASTSLEWMVRASNMVARTPVISRSGSGDPALLDRVHEKRHSS